MFLKIQTRQPGPALQDHSSGLSVLHAQLALSTCLKTSAGFLSQPPTIQSDQNGCLEADNFETTVALLRLPQAQGQLRLDQIYGSAFLPLAFLYEQRGHVNCGSRHAGMQAPTVHDITSTLTQRIWVPQAMWQGLNPGQLLHCRQSYVVMNWEKTPALTTPWLPKTCNYFHTALAAS